MHHSDIQTHFGNVLHMSSGVADSNSTQLNVQLAERSYGSMLNNALTYHWAVLS